MKSAGIMTIAAALAIIAGCSCECDREHQQMLQSRKQTDSRLSTWAHEASVENAILAQHTLFPYHFVPNSAELNELGMRDLGVLARHYQENPGRLSVRRSGTEQGIYRARLDRVGQLLRQAGVNVAAVDIADAPAGGEGMDSEQVLHILRKEAGETPPSYYREPRGAAGLAGGEE